MSLQHPGSVEIYWDESAGPLGVGWAWRLVWSDKDGNVIREESGALEGWLDEDPAPSELFAAACAELKGLGVAPGLYGSYEETSPGLAYRWKEKSARPLHKIAADIQRLWPRPYFGAVPYVRAMLDLDTVRDAYGVDSGESIVRYFLSNARTWKGDDARRIKAELQAALKGRP